MHLGVGVVPHNIIDNVSTISKTRFMAEYYESQLDIDKCIIEYYKCGEDKYLVEDSSKESDTNNGKLKTLLTGIKKAMQKFIKAIKDMIREFIKKIRKLLYKFKNKSVIKTSLHNHIGESFSLPSEYDYTVRHISDVEAVYNGNLFALEIKTVLNCADNINDLIDKLTDENADDIIKTVNKEIEYAKDIEGKCKDTYLKLFPSLTNEDEIVDVTYDKNLHNMVSSILFEGTEKANDVQKRWDDWVEIENNGIAKLAGGKIHELSGLILKFMKASAEVGKYIYLFKLGAIEFANKVSNNVLTSK